MKHLLQCRINKIFAATNDEETEFDKYHEIVLLVDEPRYARTNAGDLIRERGVDELRFVVADSMFDRFIEQLQELRKAKKTELG